MTSVRVTPTFDPNKTYPIVTRMGIREMAGDVANNFARRQLSDHDLIMELFERVEYLEQRLLFEMRQK